LAREDKRRSPRPPLARLVYVPVAVPDEIQPRARPELHEIQDPSARPLRNAQEARQEHPAALHLIRLHALLRHEPPQERGLGDERGLRLLGDRAERGGIAHGEVGEHLAIELDVRLPQARDELVVREPLLPRRRVDPDDPEAPEVALPVLPVAVGVDERVLDLLLRALVGLALEPPVALRLLEDLAPLLARVNRSLDARHLLPPQERQNVVPVARDDLL